MVHVEVTPRAATDIAQHIAFLAEHSQKAAAGFEFELKSAIQRLESLPQMGTALKSRDKRLRGIRVTSVPKYRNYCVFFRLTNDAVLIIRVLHGARNWQALFDDDA